MRQTSIEAYRHLVECGNLSKARSIVYEALYKHGPMTSTQTWRMVPNLGRQIQNTRFTELRDMGLLVELGTTLCPITGRNVTLWDVTDRVIPLELRKEGKKPTYKQLEAENRQLREKVERLARLGLSAF